MAQIKGRTGNPNGRPRGSRNKSTVVLQQWVHSFLSANRAQIKRDWKLLEPKDRIQLFEKLLKYSVPTMQSINAEINLDELTNDQLDFLINQIINKSK